MSTVRTPTRMVGAVDIGGTKIAAGLVDECGHVVARQEVPTGTDFGHAMESVHDLLSNAVRVTSGQLVGIGIGCTGPIDPFTGVMGKINFFPHWEGCNPVSVLSQAFGVRVAAENDGDAAALGEARRGTGKGTNHLICVTVGTGIGVGIVLDGRVYRGFEGIHPEPGHHIIEPSGPICSCGARGCWESLAGGPAISEWFTHNAPEGRSMPDITTEEICARARKGDVWCLRAVDRGALYLGIGIANLISVFAPEAIALGGSVMKSSDLFLGKIRSTVSESCRLVPSDRTTIGLASLGSDVGLIGAAEVWRYRIEGEGGEA
jgi:glucokinase